MASTPSRTTRRRIAAALALIVAVLAVALAARYVTHGARPTDPDLVQAADTTDTEDAEATATPAPQPVDASLDVLDAVVDAPAAADATAPATEALTTVLAAESTALTDPAGAPDMSPVLAGDALAEHEATVAQYRAEDLRAEGAARPTEVRVLGADAQEITTEACVDTSEVRVWTTDGVEVTDGSAPRRSRMVFTFRPGDGGWTLAERAFASEPAC